MSVSKCNLRSGARAIQRKMREFNRRWDWSFQSFRFWSDASRREDGCWSPEMLIREDKRRDCLKSCSFSRFWCGRKATRDCDKTLTAHIRRYELNDRMRFKQQQHRTDEGIREKNGPKGARWVYHQGLFNLGCTHNSRTFTQVCNNLSLDPPGRAEINS